ncbi:hypothetical protein ES703_90279 [subsurface metagenome]
MVKQAVILCGGKGTRLNDSLRYQPTEEVPKPLVEVGGKPFVTYAINMLKGIGISDVVLLVGHMKEKFEFLKDGVVRLVETQEGINKAVLAIPDLQFRFLLLNGDCFPIMDWRTFVNTDTVRVAVKVIGRDAGIAVVEKWAAEQDHVDCGSIGSMVDKMENYTILGGLHIGTYQGLARARLFMDTVVFGQ